MRNITLTIAAFLYVLTAYSQDNATEPSIQSPNATAMARSGEIPVSFFTGTPNINIPIGQIKTGPITVNIDLDYNAEGCRLDQHPTWVGLNWSLNAGGVIRRQTNGEFDEQIAYSGNLPSYLDLFPSLGLSNWNTIAGINSIGKEIAPDEFNFTFNGISGSFIMNHLGEWVVRSKDNLHLKVEHVVTTDYYLGSFTQNMPRAFTRFIITTDDGTKYVFGEQSNALEYSVGSRNTMIEPWNNVVHPIVPPIASNPNWFKEIQISAWNLYQIIAPTGNTVTFNYSRVWSLQQNIYSLICDNGNFNTTGDISQASKFSVAGSCLENIVTDNNIVCTFIKSPSNELKWIYKEKPESHDGLNSGGAFAYYKLNNIQIRENNNVLVKNISFSYIEKPTERLKLKRVKFLSIQNSEVKSEYGIEYNPKLLPIYNTGEEDHWGFYNGKNFWNGMSSQSNIGQMDELPFNLDAYYLSREPDATLMDAEIIKKITYPSGGYSEFIFEPHQYSKLVNYDTTVSLSQFTTPQIAGGLRIKKVLTYDALGGTPLTKEYFYINNYIGQGLTSSGILAGKPSYYDRMVMGPNQVYSRFSSSALNYMNTTNGNHITYTEVVEKSNEGYTVYTFTNHDNGYMDKPPFAQINPVTLSSSISKRIFGKLNLERGLALKTQVYNNGKVLLRQESNTYNSDPNRYNSYVRSIQSGIGLLYVNLTAIPIYTFHPYLSAKTISEYSSDGGALSNTTSYTYDATYRFVRSITTPTSEGNILKTRFKYPTDFTYVATGLPAANEIYDISAMVARHIINVPVEKIESITKGGTEYLTHATMVQFEDSKVERIFDLGVSSPLAITGLFESSSTTTGFNYDSRYKEKVYISKYDTKGNILEMTPKNGPVISYVWAYNKSYPIAKVVNATNAVMNTAVGSTPLNNIAASYDNTQIALLTTQLRTGLPNAQVSSYLYAPSIGMISETQPNGIVSSYTYDDFGRLVLTKDNDSNPVTSTEYGYDHYKRLSVNPPAIDFGSVVVNTANSKSVTLYNTGNLPVTISSVTVGAPFTCSVSNNVIQPDGSVELTVNLNSGVINPVSQTVIINSDAENSSTIPVVGNVTGTRIISLSSSTGLAFGTVYGSPVSFPTVYRNLTITNQGTGTLTISGISFPAGFTATGGVNSLSPGQSVTLSVSFTPVIPGSHSGTITVNCDKTSGTNTANVSGTAVLN